MDICTPQNAALRKRVLEPWGLGKISALLKEGELELFLLLLLWAFTVSKVYRASVPNWLLSQLLQTPSCYSSHTLHPLCKGKDQPGSDELDTP